MTRKYLENQNIEKLNSIDEQIKLITVLLNELDLYDMCYEEYETEFMKQSVNTIKEEMWRLYCFVNDVCDTLNNNSL